MDNTPVKIYRYTLRFLSNLGSIPSSAQIAGYFLYYLSIVDKDRFEEVLSDYIESPRFVVSSLFPHGCIIKPSLPAFIRKEDVKHMRNYLRERKKRKSIIYMNTEKLFNSQIIDASMLENADSTEIIRYKRIHNRVNRLIFASEDPFIEEEFFVDKMDLYLWFSDPDMKRLFDEIFSSFIAKSGIGKNTSCGSGRFEIEKEEEIELKTEGQYLLSLGFFIPCSYTELKYYRTTTVFGKHSLYTGTSNIFKAPLVMIDRGAVVKNNGSGIIIGRNIDAQKESISFNPCVIQGKQIGVPFDFDSSMKDLLRVEDEI